MDEETRAEGKERQGKALQSFAKEFGRGLRQQRTRGKTKKELVHFHLLWVCSEGMRRHMEKSMLREIQGSEGQTTVQDAAAEYDMIYSKGDVVALKHNYKRYIIL